MTDWFGINLEQFSGIIFTTFLAYVALLIIVKINGLRSFAKMSGHDFAVTVAIGSILASISLSKEPSILQGGLAISSLLLIQSAFSYWRIHRGNSYLENKPLLIIKEGDILHENLVKAKMTEEDLMAKLREANVLKLGDVKAAVFETTGDVSILHGEGELDNALLLKDVKDC